MTSGQAHMTHLVIVCLADTQKTKKVDFQFLIFLFYLDLVYSRLSQYLCNFVIMTSCQAHMTHLVTYF